MQCIQQILIERRTVLKQLQFTDESEIFFLEHPEKISYLYFPLASENGLKSCVTPNLGGDSKINQNTFLLEPVSSENLHNNRAVRNFWIKSKNGDIFSATGASDSQEAAKFSSSEDSCRITAGFMWHTLERVHNQSILTQITSFIPYNDNVEIMYITIHNHSNMTEVLTPYAAIPIYGRSADNIRDHRNVTSMLHRIKTVPNGISVCPTMSFDERGHHRNNKVYYTYGYSSRKEQPESFYPTVEDFLGEGGSYTHPRAIYESYPGVPAGSYAAGKEAMGAFRFPQITLSPHEEVAYAILIGVADNEKETFTIYKKYSSIEKILSSLEETRKIWHEKVNVNFITSDRNFDRLMKWICFQPYLRRLFGCSFLPHHDYGRGGRGWRDLWQDCLSLLIMNPQDVGKMIEINYGGVRIDGTNATIIGDGDGNFIADRNNITRVWMDHALWPEITTRLYIDQTGDISILNKMVPYFKDAQAERGTGVDKLWDSAQGSRQLTVDGQVYTGTILEHLLIQQLTAFYDTGEHNIYRLRGADWNDALDMAAERGESVAFTCAYAGNLQELASMIRLLQNNLKQSEATLIEELKVLLYDDIEGFEDIYIKKDLLTQYTNSCRHTISGRHFTIKLSELADNLERKAQWLTDYLRKNEWINGRQGEGWFNSYYDNNGRAVEGIFPEGTRMMLTGQVFAIMGNVASKDQISRIVQSSDRYLYCREIGGYRLNTDFHELKFDMGRMFGFAYGEKENGAVFSHMTVMYANALYKRGFVKEGWKALKTLADTALNFKTSRIYPGIPEYFRSDGRGMYHYLTGAASWFMLTMITQVFGVRGEAGDMIFDPKLMAEQFDKSGTASISVAFANKKFEIIYTNPKYKNYGSYAIGSAICDDTYLKINKNGSAVLPRENIDLIEKDTVYITINLI